MSNESKAMKYNYKAYVGNDLVAHIQTDADNTLGHDVVKEVLAMAIFAHMEKRPALRSPGEYGLASVVIVHGVDPAGRKDGRP